MPRPRPRPAKPRPAKPGASKPVARPSKPAPPPGAPPLSRPALPPPASPPALPPPHSPPAPARLPKASPVPSLRSRMPKTPSTVPARKLPRPPPSGLPASPPRGTPAVRPTRATTACALGAHEPEEWGQLAIDALDDDETVVATLGEDLWPKYVDNFRHFIANVLEGWLLERRVFGSEADKEAAIGRLVEATRAEVRKDPRGWIARHCDHG